MKIIHLTIILMFVLSLFSIASADLIQESSKTLSEKVLDETNEDKDTQTLSFQESYFVSFVNLTSSCISSTPQHIYTFKYSNTPLRPPIFS